MNIIKARENHIEDIVKMCEKCKSHMIRNNIDQWDEIYPNKSVFEKDILEGNLYVGISNVTNNILGCIVLDEFQDEEYNEVKWIYNNERVIVIHRLMIDPNEQGKGLAQELLKFAEEKSINEKYKSIRLDVFKENQRAVEFYKSNGYNYVGQVQFRKGIFLCGEKKLCLTPT